MTGLFERHLGRKMKPCEAAEEQLFYLRKVLSPQQLKQRQEIINKNKLKPEQLKLF